MNKTLITLSAVVAAVFAAQGAVAQDKTRAEVKAEAKDAVKSGKVEKGEGSASPTAGAKSTADRKDVKAEAAAGEKAGTLVKGEGPAAEKKPVSTKARADVKKEAAAAEKAGTIEKGEGPAKK